MSEADKEESSLPRYVPGLFAGSATMRVSAASTQRSPQMKEGVKSRSIAIAKAGAPKKWMLRLYVAGQTPRSLAALQNLQIICEEHLPGRWRAEVVDVLLHPEIARDHQILVLPTLVRLAPQPVRRVVGDLSNTERVLAGMQFPGSQR